MRYSAWSLCGTAGLLMALHASGAHAQDAGQEAWIGQTGETNTIAITQQGRGNRAGRDNAAFRLNQDGEFNFLSIDQYGWSNTVGSELRSAEPRGLNQIGDRNSVTVEQRDGDPLGSNSVGAILQSGPRLNSERANILFIRQDAADGADLTAGHSIGAVSQINDGPEGGVANSATIRQSGGGEGNGNAIDTIVQQGQANILAVFQNDQSNVVQSVRQDGVANDATIEQGGGDANWLQVLKQYGDANRADVSLSGSRNVVQRVLQDNTNLSGIGNRASIVVTGDDNGGDGLGGPDEFLAAETLALPGVWQGHFVQMGDDNGLRVTISQGSETKVGVWQERDGNGAIVSISAPDGQLAKRNESAIVQRGLDNDLSHIVVGSENVMAASQDGQRNRAALTQTGTGNVATLSVSGDDNNGVAAGAFRDSARLVAEQASLQPGELIQDGVSNRADMRVDGSRNLSAFEQHGETNRLFATMAGSGNAVAVVQAGNADTSITVQTGAGNTLGVHQY